MHFKAAKRYMVHMLNNADLTDEKLMTVMVGAEGLMNSKRITYQSSNVDQVGGHFAPKSVDTEPYNPRVRWQHVKKLFTSFGEDGRENGCHHSAQEGNGARKDVTYKWVSLCWSSRQTYPMVNDQWKG